MDHDCSFEEFKVYYESTELVSDRRIATTRWNYSVGVVVLGGEALLLKWAFADEQFLVLALAGAILISGVATAFSYFWLRQIDDYKSLNNAKFAVLNEMAPRLRFPSTDSSGHENGSDDMQVESFQPFMREWEKLQATQALVSIRGRGHRLSALSAGNIERFIPKCFFALFVAVIVLCVVLGVTNWSTVTHSLTCTLGGLRRSGCFSGMGNP